MFRMLAALPALILAYSVWAMGAPGKSYAPKDCISPRAFDQTYIEAQHQLALIHAAELYSQRADVYGFPARFSATFYNAVAVASELINLTAGRPLWRPDYPQSARNQAAAGILEFALETEVAVALGVTRCTAGMVTPERNVDSLTSASAKLEYLIARLKAERP